MKKHTCALFAAGSLALMLVSGCGTPTDTAAKPAADKDEYVTLEPEIGSRVKKRVKKSELPGYVGMSPSKKDKVTSETDMNSIPQTTSGEMEKSAATGR